MDKLTVRDFDPAGKRVLVRVDFNVPIEDGKVKDDTRIRAALPTITYLLKGGASVILMSHLGRPNGKVVESARLRPVAQRLSQLLRMSVPCTGDALGLGTEDAIGRLKPGQVLLLENLRFHAAEEANDPEFAKALAAYGDVYVNDAFGTAHRAHASTVGVAKFLPAYAGLLMEKEIANLSKLLEDPEHPFAAVIGGAKVSGKIAVLENLMDKVDTFVIGGGMANTFLAAKGLSVGKSLLEKDRIDDAKRILETAEAKGIAFLLPTDIVVAKEVTRGAEHKIVPAHKIPNSWSAVDVGPVSTKAFEEALEPARTDRLERPAGRVRGADLRRRHAVHGALPDPARPRRARRSSSAAATRSRPSRSSSSPTRSPMSPPAAVPASSSSRARSCRASRSSRIGRRPA